MIDDLVTRGTEEPYRMFTSRAEYRLMLREDNADLRLVEKAHSLGLVKDETLAKTKLLEADIQKEIKRLREYTVKPSKEVNTYLEASGTPPITTGIKLDQLLKRAQLNYSAVDTLFPDTSPVSPRVKKQVEIEIKYEGYIARQHREIKKFRDMEVVKIPKDMDYTTLNGLSNEIREKLISIMPESLGQASRIDGMTPAAISIIMIGITALRKAGAN
ncbi:hypothetical protein [Desulfamplus magnetovallimortis]|uniref:hypothetical protein n=1 Tax=Desulfamplus magnetovallimortis TaxID=1246637 RepID=UPI0031832025